MDFRTFLKSLEQAGELLRIPDTLHLEDDGGAPSRQLSDANGPAAFLQNVRGSALPLAINVYGTRGRVARALGVSEAEMLAHVAERLKQRIPTKAHASGAPRCQEVVIAGADVD